MEDARRLIPLSALQHYLFCARQCALIHIEQQWADNRYTAEGGVLHERADHYGHERRRGVQTFTALPLANEYWGLTGIADVVEFDNSGDTQVVRPIEYKRGRPKAHRADEVQLCAQALCLEEMLAISITEGALFYGKTRRRKTVPLDTELRTLTTDVIKATRSLFESNTTPVAVYDPKRCDHCSLFELCQPKAMGKQRRASAWLARQLQE